MKDHVNDFALKEVTRKEFLTIAGIGLTSIFGISTILRLLNGKNPSHNLLGGSGSGYGSSAYGGHRSAIKR